MEATFVPLSNRAVEGGEDRPHGLTVLPPCLALTHPRLGEGGSEKPSLHHPVHMFRSMWRVRGPESGWIVAPRREDVNTGVLVCR